MATAIDHPTFFTSLPGEYYHSQEIFDREIERIFHRQWLWFGHTSHVPEPGDYLARELAGESVVVSRGEDREVHAFLNVCRHRGARLCPIGSGHAKPIICPYHRWSYASDGRLLGAPSIPKGESIEYGDWGLLPVQVEVWQGFIFVCLGVEPVKPLASHFGDSELDFTRLHLDRVKEAHRIVYDVDANWKIVLENSSECYHCPGVHPELCRVLDAASLGAEVQGHLAESELDADARKYMADSDGKLRPGAETFSLDGKFVSKKHLGEFGGDGPLPPGYYAGVRISPALTFIQVHTDHLFVYEVRPVSLDRTEVITSWFVRDDAEAGLDYEVDSLIAITDITNREDWEVCELTQQGTKSRRYTPGPLSRREYLVHAALTSYLEMIGTPMGEAR